MSLEDELKFKALLDKASHIINRIMSKAASPYGLAGGHAFGQS